MGSNDAGKKPKDVLASYLEEEISASEVDDGHYASEEELPKRTARDTRKFYSADPFSKNPNRDMYECKEAPVPFPGFIAREHKRSLWQDCIHSHERSDVRGSTCP